MSQPICQTIQGIQQTLDGKNTNLSKLVSRVIDYEITCLEDQNALCQRGISVQKQAVDWIAKAIEPKIKRDSLTAYADNCLKEYQMMNTMWSHRQRRELLETNIRMLLPEMKNNDLFTQMTLARTYLFRSLLYRPKGRIEPARKTEALKKAIQLADKVLELLASGNENDQVSETDAWRLWAQANIELYRISDTLPHDFMEKMESVTLMIDSDDIADINDIFILLIYSEQSRANDAFDDSFISHILNETRDWERPYDMQLAKARVHILLEEFDQAAPLISKSIQNAPNAFSDPFWNDLINTLIKIWKSNSSQWQTLSIQAYEACKEKEKEMVSNIPLRWYWARQKDLYDLAFMASETEEKKAEIADSVKSRPVLRYNTLHGMKEKYSDIIGDILDQEDEARDGRYLKHHPLTNRQNTIKSSDLKKRIKKSQISHDQLPEPWIAVHFYINEREKIGHALIYQARNQKWFDCTFDYQQLEYQFLAWQEPYLIGESSDQLESLGIEKFPDFCKEIGKCMPFLFDPQYFPEDFPVLFIPHGFLHRLPFHAAIKEKSIFLHHHVCRYLPAWHMASSQTDIEPNDTSYLLKNYEYDYNELIKLEWTEIIEQAGPADIQSILMKSPSILVLLCHGEGDILNPFKSKLRFNPEISLLDILKTETDIQNALVLLGACESDMAPPANKQNLLDEHLSMASVFLTKSAKEVVASLWRIDEARIEEVFIILSKCDDPAEKLREYQQEELEEWVDADIEEEIDAPFYDPTIFRVIGFPFLTSNKINKG